MEKSNELLHSQEDGYGYVKCGINNGNDGAYGSGGSMNNPMYRNIACDGNYESMTGRGKQRYIQKKNGASLSKKKKFWELSNVEEVN